MEETETVEEPKPETMEEAKPETMEEAKPEGAAPERPARTGSDNTVFVGKKSTMGYVLAVVTQFNNGAKEVNVKARGKLISRAVDVVEIVRHRFLPDANVGDIQISTEELTSEDGSRSKVSSIEIKMVK